MSILWRKHELCSNEISGDIENYLEKYLKKRLFNKTLSDEVILTVSCDGRFIEGLACAKVKGASELLKVLKKHDKIVVTCHYDFARAT